MVSNALSKDLTNSSGSSRPTDTLKKPSVMPSAIRASELRYLCELLPGCEIVVPISPRVGANAMPSIFSINLLASDL